MDDHHELTAAYALDALDPRERERYENHLATCESCREELASFWAVSGALAHAAGGPSPAPALRERILAQAKSEQPNVVRLRPRWALPATASLAAVAAVLALGFGLWSASLSRELDRERTALAGTGDALAIVSDPDAHTVAFRGADGHIVVSDTGKAAVVLSGIDPAPAGKTYELWVVEGGVFRPAGLFEGGEARLVQALSRPVAPDAKVAVTLEEDGGVETPTQPPLFATV
ncbi:MAG: anti-sigma factor [Actinobacteria bacterium]|nr:anti-sigma factor [Actinomycetota bacterium]